MGVKGDLESPPKVAEEPTEFGWSPTKVKTTEAIIVKPISMVPPMETKVIETGKKPEPAPVKEPIVIDIEKSELPKEEPTKESSDMSDIFAAGTDTSYITLEWTMAELARSPNRLKRVQDEIRGILGNKSKVKEDDITKMKYLKAVIKESLRLHPPAPLLVPRESLEATKIQGYEIPKKTRILVNAFSIGQDPEFWEEAHEFRPERFLNNLIDFKGNDFRFIPFGAGRRICPGMHLAISTIELSLANLLYRFDWKLPNNMSPEDLDMWKLMECQPDIFAAGTDTTYITLKWAMAALARSPKILQRVQGEIREILGNKSKVNEDDISKMNYLKAVIKEDPECWEEAHEFRPDRFWNNPIDFKGNDLHFILFSAGRKICPAMHFAISITELALANMLYGFDWKLPDNMNPEDLDMVETFGLATRMKSDLLLRCVPYKA
ncbi:uncharacterized protein [Elaeis guineensis]|uniref:uncharacterized protein n=1 Tax=Elaeis guineensis var. tenera TaxID=51953 RepID=UPI003C6D6F4D